MLLLALLLGVWPRLAGALLLLLLLQGTSAALLGGWRGRTGGLLSQC